MDTLTLVIHRRRICGHVARSVPEMTYRRDLGLDAVIWRAPLLLRWAGKDLQAVMLVLVLVLMDSLRSKMQSLSWSLSLTMQSLSLSLSLLLKSLSLSLLLKSLSLSWSLNKIPWSCPCDCVTVQMEIAIRHVALIAKYFTTDKHFTYYLLTSEGWHFRRAKIGNPGNVDLKLSYVSFGKFWPV